MLRGLQLRVRNLLRRRQLDRNLEDELQFHLEMAAQENMDSGMDPDQARLEARRRFGNAAALKERGRDMFSFAWTEALIKDISYGLRVLSRNPGFTSAVVVTLALGIGMNVAIFSLVYGVLLRPLPYQAGDRLVVLHQQGRRANVPNFPFSVKEILDYRNSSRTLDAVVEHHTMNFLLLGPDGAERVNTAVVSPNFFDVLGVKPLLGRTFVESDDTHDAPAVLVLSYAYWKGRYGGDPNIVGKVFQMNNRPHTVIGVLPPIPQYPVENDVYMPTSHCPFRSAPSFIENRQSRMMTGFGRLKPGVPLEQAQADLSLIAQRMEKDNPEAYPQTLGYALALNPLREDLTRRAQSTFLILLGGAGLVLLIACANVANLLLARLLRLQKELALRVALGAGKLRLIRQLLTESVMLSLAGGILGLALAPLALRILVKFAERFTTRAAEIQIDTPVLFFAALISIAAGLLFGLGPAVSSGKNVADTLKQGGGRNTAGWNGQRLRAGLVVAQVAVSFILLIGGGLMVRSFVRLQRVNPGFTPSHLLTLRISPNFTKYVQSAQFQKLSEDLLRTIKTVPGVETAALTTNFPFNRSGIENGPRNTRFVIEGRPANEAAMVADSILVTAGYFETLRQPVLQGRSLSEDDDAYARRVAVVNQTMAKHRWPNEDPIGKRISFTQGSVWLEIVGVVGDAKEYGLDRPNRDEVYVPAAQPGTFGSNLVIRTTADPKAVSAAARAAIRAVDSQLAVDRVETIEDLQEESLASPRVTAILLGLFAALALAISAGGIAAVIALMVSQRTNELGIRMALGASRLSIVYMVLRQGLLLTLIGSAVGIAGAIGLTRLLSAMLYDTSPTDAGTFASMSLLFLAIAAAACLIPARRVTAIDPLIALRLE